MVNAHELLLHKMNRAALVGSLVLVGGAFYWWSARRAEAATLDAMSEAPRLDLSGVLAQIEADARAALGSVGDLAPSTGTWSPPAQAAPYVGMIDAAERTRGIPRGLLARLLYQESRFRSDVIDGRTRSRAGAIGIAQFMPATAAQYGIDPTKPAQVIPAAADLLAQLYQRFGSWQMALAAYNWGQGNVAAFIRTGRGASGQVRPDENVDYVSEITADVPVA